MRLADAPSDVHRIGNDRSGSGSSTATGSHRRPLLARRQGASTSCRRGVRALRRSWPSAPAPDDRLTETGLALGTPAYMSPEQALADATLDGRTDLYSLGCVLYELLTGEPPYTGPTAQSIVAKRLSDPVPSARRLRETVPPAVDDILQRLLAKSPADRFASAAELGAALAALPTTTATVPAADPHPAAAPPYRPTALPPYRPCGSRPPLHRRGRIPRPSPPRPRDIRSRTRSERRRHPAVPRHRARPRPRLPRRGSGRSARRQARRLGRDPRGPAPRRSRGVGRPARDGAVRRRGGRGRAPGRRRDGPGREPRGLGRGSRAERHTAFGRWKRGRGARLGGREPRLAAGAGGPARRPAPGRAGRGATTLGELSTTRAITEYLQGKTAMRQGRYGEAKAHYGPRCAKTRPSRSPR